MIVLDLNDVDIRNLTFDSLMGYLKKNKNWHASTVRKATAELGRRGFGSCGSDMDCTSCICGVDKWFNMTSYNTGIALVTA